MNRAIQAAITIVARPVSETIRNQRSVPAKTGHSRASRKMPAFTMVAECRYAETGVGAAMAWGSQKWKGNWADLVKAPIRIRIRAGPKSGDARTWSPRRMISLSSYEPAISPSISMPAISASPPPPVTISAMRAPWRESGR